MLVELIYQSMPATETVDVKGILEVARRKNAKLNITGMLCFDGKMFIQLLEAEEAIIDALYAAIEHDKRHKDIELLHRGKISKRSFDDWSMAYENIPEGMLETLSERIGVMSMMQMDTDIAAIGDSFGDRLFGLFPQQN